MSQLRPSRGALLRAGAGRRRVAEVDARDGLAVGVAAHEAKIGDRALEKVHHRRTLVETGHRTSVDGKNVRWIRHIASHETTATEQIKPITLPKYCQALQYIVLFKASFGEFHQSV